MTGSDPFVEHCLDLLQPLGPVTLRRMFGGYGLFHERVMFALIAFEQLYFKVDAETEGTFAASDTQAFVYQGKTKPITMSYRSAPSQAMEEPESLLPWAHLAVAAARRGQTRKAAARKPATPKPATAKPAQRQLSKNRPSKSGKDPRP